MSILQSLTDSIATCSGVADNGDGTYRIDFAAAPSRLATADEILAATKASKIGTINAECRARLFARYGNPEEQVSRALGIYGQAERDAMQAGIAATVDASNTASNAVIAAADLAAVEAVTVTWPVI